uniref:HORMA domain-containing protein n=1 Tax=Macrostomum lignano TaxID=282301 RepID=A0A1I8FS49_9PLAT
TLVRAEVVGSGGAAAGRAAGVKRLAIVTIQHSDSELSDCRGQAATRRAEKVQIQFRSSCHHTVAIKACPAPPGRTAKSPPAVASDESPDPPRRRPSETAGALFTREQQRRRQRKSGDRSRSAQVRPRPAGRSLAVQQPARDMSDHRRGSGTRRIQIGFEAVCDLRITESETIRRLRNCGTFSAEDIPRLCSAFYTAAVCRMSPRHYVSENLRAACDYVWCRFTGHHAEVRDLQGLLHEFVDGASLSLSTVLEERGERECQIVILADEDVVDWDEDHPQLCRTTECCLSYRPFLRCRTGEGGEQGRVTLISNALKSKSISDLTSLVRLSQLNVRVDLPRSFDSASCQTISGSPQRRVLPEVLEEALLKDYRRISSRAATAAAPPAAEVE